MNAAPETPEKQNDRQRGGHSCPAPGSAPFYLEPRAGSGTSCGLVGVGGVFFGLPPFAPFARAASDLASEVARPPRRPSACAALFGIGIEDGFPNVIVVFGSNGLRSGVRPVVSRLAPDYVGVSRVNPALDVETALVAVADRRVAHFGTVAVKRFVDRCDEAFFAAGDVIGFRRCHVSNRTEPLGFVTNYFGKSSEREIPSGRRGCGAGGNARERHEGKVPNARISEPSGGRDSQ